MSNEQFIINNPKTVEISEEEMTMATRDPDYGMETEEEKAAKYTEVGFEVIKITDSQLGEDFYAVTCPDCKTKVDLDLFEDHRYDHHYIGGAK